MFGTPDEIEAAMRKEESDALLMQAVTSQAADVREQLHHASEWIRELTGLPRDEINRRLAQRRADAAANPRSPSP